MKDSGYFESGLERLFHTANLPDIPGRCNTGIIFVHADGGNRCGPHRMFVEFSDKLSDCYACIRFDLTGCGDSSGVSTDSEVAHRRDIIAAVSHFRELYRLENVFLAGISRGAYLINQILSERNLPVAGAICLSCPTNSRKAALQTISERLKGYCFKLMEQESLVRLIRGQVNIRYIFRSFFSTYRLTRKYVMPLRSKGNEKTKCPRLFVYGQSDPMCATAIEFYVQQCQELGIACERHVIEYANHSFFHYAWKEQIYVILRKWLDSKIDEIQKTKAAT